MALPDNTTSSQTVSSTLLPPDDQTFNPLLDYERGGVALNDPSQGLRVQDWLCYQRDSVIYVRDAAGLETAVLSVPGGVNWLSLAFDQNMQPAIAYVLNSDGVPRLYWYDTTIPGYATLTLTGTSYPRLCMDDKRPLSSATSDIILGYVKDGSLYYRQQRDRFNVERPLPSDVPAQNKKLVTVAMGRNNRLHFGFLQ